MPFNPNKENMNFQLKWLIEEYKHYKESSKFVLNFYNNARNKINTQWFIIGTMKTYNFQKKYINMLKKSFKITIWFKDIQKKTLISGKL